MLKTWGRAFMLLLVMTIITEIAYPFPHQANASLALDNNNNQ